MLIFCRIYFVVLILAEYVENFDIFKLFSQRRGALQGTNYTTEYSFFSEAERVRSRDRAKQMFYFGYDNYIKYAFPMDELDPIHCTGRGPDYDNP